MNLTARRKVTDPGGTQWTVRPRWRVGPEVRLRKRDRSDADGGWVDFADFGAGGDDVVSAIFGLLFLVVVIVATVFVVWPLLALAIEILIALLLVAAGVVARFAFGKPWIVEATTNDRGGLLRYSVRGYGAMRRVCAEVADRIARGDVAPTIVGAKRV